MELLNTKYGNSWRTEVSPQVVTDFETKKSGTVGMTEITHRGQGTNPKTGYKGTLHATSLDLVFTHTMPPMHHAELEIKLVSKNFQVGGRGIEAIRVAQGSATELAPERCRRRSVTGKNYAGRSTMPAHRRHATSPNSRVGARNPAEYPWENKDLPSLRA